MVSEYAYLIFSEVIYHVVHHIFSKIRIHPNQG